MEDFDLIAYLGEHFPGLELGAGLFHRWQLGIRFEIGRSAVPDRPIAIFEAIFSVQDACVLISQDWPMIGLASSERSRYFSLLSQAGLSDPVFNPTPEQLPNVFDPALELAPQHMEIRIEGEQEPGLDRFRLSWMELPARSFQYDKIFHAIANSDHGEAPSMSSRVYFLNRRTHSIFHMYDDRGADVVSASREPLLPLYTTFNDWVLEYDRSRIISALNINN